MTVQFDVSRNCRPYEMTDEKPRNLQDVRDRVHLSGKIFKVSIRVSVFISSHLNSTIFLLVFVSIVLSIIFSRISSQFEQINSIQREYSILS